MTDPSLQRHSVTAIEPLIVDEDGQLRSSLDSTDSLEDDVKAYHEMEEKERSSLSDNIKKISPLIDGTDGLGTPWIPLPPPQDEEKDDPTIIEFMIKNNVDPERYTMVEAQCEFSLIVPKDEVKAIKEFGNSSEWTSTIQYTFLKAYHESKTKKEKEENGKHDEDNRICPVRDRPQVEELRLD